MAEFRKSINFYENKSDHDQRTTSYNPFERVLGKRGTQETQVSESRGTTDDGRRAGISPQALRQKLAEHDQRTAIYNQFERVLGKRGTQEAEIGKSETSDGRGVESANRVSPQAVRKILIDSSKQTGSYIDDVPSISSEQHPSGHESEVYRSKDSESVSQ